MGQPYKIKALIDFPLGGLVRIGEIGTHIGNGNYNFPSQKGYSAINWRGKFEVIEQNKNPPIRNILNINNIIMAKKQQVKDGISANDKRINNGIEPIKPIDKIVDLAYNDEQLLILHPIPSGDLGKTFDTPDQINTNFESNDSHLGIEFTQQDYLEQVVYYSEELLVSLEGIFIGGHASQIKDQLYIALNNYKNGI